MDKRNSCPFRLSGDQTLRTLFTPPTPRLVGDIDLDFDADKILFSMPNDAGHWNLYEIDDQGKGLRQITPDKDLPDVHHFDGCYLPDGRIAFASTAPLQGVPCNTSVTTATAFRRRRR